MYNSGGTRVKARTRIGVGAQDAASIEVEVPLLLVRAFRASLASSFLPARGLQQVRGSTISLKINYKASASFSKRAS